MFQAIAIMYFKQFYQKWYVMEHDPKRIMWILQHPRDVIGYKYKSRNYYAIILLTCNVAIYTYGHNYNFLVILYFSIWIVQ